MIDESDRCANPENAATTAALGVRKCIQRVHGRRTHTLKCFYTNFKNKKENEGFAKLDEFINCLTKDQYTHIFNTVPHMPFVFHFDWVKPNPPTAFLRSHADQHKRVIVGKTEGQAFEILDTTSMSVAAVVDATDLQGMAEDSASDEDAAFAIYNSPCKDYPLAVPTPSSGTTCGIHFNRTYCPNETWFCSRFGQCGTSVEHQEPSFNSKYDGGNVSIRQDC